MKKIVFIILLFPLLVLGQSKNQNFVKTVTYKNPSTATITAADTIQNIDYFDGIGRLIQKIAAKGGGNSRDLVIPIEYDSYGQQTKQYLPYANAGTGGLFSSPSYRPSIIPTQENYYKTKYPEDVYGTTTVTYSEIKTDGSPLGRVTEQAAPGTNWAMGSGHTITTEYATNVYGSDAVWDFRVQFTGNDTEKPELYIPSSAPIVGRGGYYSTGSLYKTIYKDENWTSADGNNKTTHEFKDKQGRFILKRTFNEGQPHDTYYVYDDFGNLAFVLPPMTNDATLVTRFRPSTPPLAWTEYTIDQTLVQKYGYMYSYDSRNRVVEKKIPGKDAEYIGYDKLDRPVLTQTALQRNAAGVGQKWLFVKYDKFNRIVYSGEYTSTATRTALQNSVNAATVLSESKTTTLLTLNGTSINYTNTVFPTTGIELFSANFYDNNDFNKPTSVNVPTTATEYGEVPTTNLKTLPTGSKVRVLGTTSWITTALGYDVKGRVIWSKNDNPYYTTGNTLQIKLDFMGQVLETKTEHVRTGTGYQPVTIQDYYTYDFTGRPLLHTQKVNGAATAQIISSKAYNEVGQLITKGIGGMVGTFGNAQTIDYKYNVRGWLTKINDPNSLGSDIFAESLSYNLPTTGGTALHNGNISQAAWKTSNDNNLRTYNYTYDALNRIKSGTFVNSTTSAQNTSFDLNDVKYDKNGNITFLHRAGNKVGDATQENMDKMTYFYDGNQLTRVKEDGLVNAGFKGVAPTNTATQYTYDKNGNIITDLNKDITTNIVYNQFNLPTRVTFTGGKYIDYSYDAKGTKLKKTFFNGSTSTITEYNDGFVYLKSGTANSTLEYIPTEEGYIFKNASGVFSYAYQIKDHLGNVRMTFTDLDNSRTVTANEIIEESNYDPFGVKHTGYNNATLSIGNSLALKLMYSNKEYQDENSLDWYDFGARNYNPDLGRWMNIDPLAELEFESPYSFVANNPIYYVDPTGMYKIDYRALYIAMGGDPTLLGSTELPEIILNSDQRTNWEKYYMTETLMAGFSGQSFGHGGGGSGGGKNRGNGLRNTTNYFLKTNPFIEEYDAMPWYEKIWYNNPRVIGSSGGLEFITGAGALKSTNVATSVWKHIFRNSTGHVNPSTLAAQKRYYKLFERVASNPKNIVPTLNPAAAAAGKITYKQTFRNGKTVWVEVKGTITNAGIN